MAKPPRVLIVTPEVTYLPQRMCAPARHLGAKAGGLADVSAGLINALYEQGGDIHVALPDYRSIFNAKGDPSILKELDILRSRVSDARLHLAEDKVFYKRSQVYSSSGLENVDISLAFQREVINTIVPGVQPDLIHCHDWMTGLIPAMARQQGIPCLFTIHNIHTYKIVLARAEVMGLDVASFWKNLFFDRMPQSLAESHDTNPVDFLASGIFASHFVNTVSPGFLKEVIQGRHDFVDPPIRNELANKVRAGCAVGILNSPDPSFLPEIDAAIPRRYDPAGHGQGKESCKRFAQETFGLVPDSRAPLMFWASRLDSIQKGARLMAEVMDSVMARYKNLQILFVADGDYREPMASRIGTSGFRDRAAVYGFDEKHSRMAYAAADFILMPSRFEPCGLPQIIGPIYGALPIAHDTGGIHDTVEPMDVRTGTGNGFLFQSHTAEGFSRAIDDAMAFFFLPGDVRAVQVKRVMEQSRKRFNHSVTAKQYIQLYETMLHRPLITH
ncbi:MAG: glycogen/starch synthase [Pseudomonadota bacterium]